MWQKPLKLVAVYAVAAACLLWVFHGIDLRQLRTDLAGVSWPALVLAAFLNLSVFVANSWRWKLALQPVNHVSFRHSLGATYIGVFLNEVLPLRPGEFVRSGLLSRWATGITFPVAVSSTIIERLTEAAWLELGFLGVILVARVPRFLIWAFAAFSFALVIGSIFLALVARRSGHGGSSGTESKLLTAWRRFAKGVQLITQLPTLSIISMFSFASLSLNVLATWVLMDACGITLSLAVATAVFIIIRVGTSIPSTPGNVGPYQLLSFLALRLFGVTKTAAVTFTIVTFAAVTFPLLIGGAIAFLRAGTDFSDLLSLAHRSTFRSGRVR